MRNVVIYVPFVVGIVVLTLAVVSIWSLLSLESVLDQEPAITVRADCEGYLVYLLVDTLAYQEELDEDSLGFDIGHPIVKIELEEIPFEECEYFVIDLWSDNIAEASIVATDPPQLGHTVDIRERPMNQVYPPLVAEALDEVISEALADLDSDVETPTLEVESLRITLSALDSYTDSVSIYVYWPDMYQFSHVGHGAMASLLGPYLSKMVANVYAANKENSVSKVDVGLDVDFSAPNDFAILETGGTDPTDIGKKAVAWSSEDDELFGQLGLIRSEAWLRHISYESKTKLLLIGGGAAIGLGLTLVAESFLVFLFRLERKVARRTRTKRRRPPD